MESLTSPAYTTPRLPVFREIMGLGFRVMAKAARRGAKNPAITRLVRSVLHENAELCFENFMLSVEMGLSCRSNWVSNGRASLIKSLQLYKTPKPNSRSPF